MTVTQPTGRITKKAAAQNNVPQPLNRPRNSRHAQKETHVTELKLNLCTDGVSAELTVANEGAAPFYWDWPVNLYVEDTAGSTLCTARLPLSLPELMPGKSQKVSVTLEGADAQKLLCGGWKRLFRSPKHLTIGIVDPMTSRDAVRFAMKAARKNGRTVLL